MQIVSGHHSEIWSIDVDPDARYLVTGLADLELRFYNVKLESGESMRQSKDMVATVRFSKYGNLLACQVAGKTVEMFRVLDEVESNHKAKRRLNRKKDKKSAKMEVEVTENVEANLDIEEAGNILVVTVPDVFKLLQTILASKKICSISFCPVTAKSSLGSLALSLNNNLLEFYSIESSASTRTLAIEFQGHRSDVRSVTLISDNSLLMSTSHNAVKIWNPSTGSCLQTIDSGFGLCGIIVPHNKYAMVGTKDGKIEIIDIGSGTSSEVEAHSGSVRAIATVSNENGFVTGSADHDVKFWEYQIKQKPVVAVSPDAKYVAVALLDCTIKVGMIDLSFSVLNFNLSTVGWLDGDLIVTGSADKNLRIWGLDFGDCHKSIFAHADRYFFSVMAVQFVHNTHYMFSAGKDRLINNRGDFVVTGSHDRSICRWDRTEEPFFIEEEREKRLEEIFEADIDNTFEDRHILKEELPVEGAVALAGTRTQETLTATDSIIDALDVAEVVLKRIADMRYPSLALIHLFYAEVDDVHLAQKCLLELLWKIVEQ
ncbi:phosphatidylinositol-4-phosphate 5-kinase family protein [Hibiscus syriacus]|uniref:Phosphatidylinositol-4-phosphate 5-kinase family protein n=1 Tax=Hibiscus syriacus TaxID=106335 RepID=A0A6A3BU59_HIBSY|nr:phosphatidylinositol-4-phosphate 5-kinase family protein [Hibiscus syriacus]